MKYAIVDLLWAKSHGIEILPEMRTSTDQSKVILHEEYLAPFDDEDFPRYSFSDPSFVELLNSEEWTYPEGEQPVIIGSSADYWLWTNWIKKLQKR